MKPLSEFADVYYAAVPQTLEPGRVGSPSRDAEIRACKNKKTGREKYAVWRLLEYAIEKSTGIDPARLDFVRTENGKWECDGIFFSLSHTEGLVAVAVSDAPIGIDAELVALRDVLRLAQRCLTEAEREELLSLDKAEATELFYAKWTAKESAFKMHGGKSFVPKSTDTAGVKSFPVAVRGARYYISVACASKEKIGVFEIVNPELDLYV